jgi:predicted AAA+ superfamily ATPase
MFSRILDITPLLEHRSVFLFGPRRTGKSTLLRELFPSAVYYDLLDSVTFRELSSSPELIRQRRQPTQNLIIIDEVQKLPGLLNEVHLLIEKHKELRFILTGSSMRKLRRGGANLLAGRALRANLYPLVTPEVPNVDLTTRLLRGGIPSILTSQIAREDLKAYVGDYLKEEIQGEFEARNLEGFSRFLDLAGTCNGEQVNYSALGTDLGINPKTIREYFQVLEDTLLGVELPSFTKCKKRKPVTTAKFYFFDIGVANILRGNSIEELSQENYGHTLEHLVFNELRAYIDYKRLDISISYWRTYTQFEVDFVLGDNIGIEVKSKVKVSRKDTKGLRALNEEVTLRRRIVVCREESARIDDDGIEIIPINEFLKELWAGKIVDSI